MDFDPAFIGISLGESDAGYISLLKGASRIPFWKISAQDIAQQIRSAFPKLVMVLESVRTVAPNARTLALGCPRPFPADGTNSTWVRPWFSKEAQAIINDAADQLAAIQETAAKVAGTYFLPLAPLFADHGICSHTGGGSHRARDPQDPRRRRRLACRLVGAHPIKGAHARWSSSLR